MPENEQQIREYTGTVTLVRSYTVLAASDFDAQSQVENILDSDVPEESGWQIANVSFQRKSIEVS